MSSASLAAGSSTAENAANTKTNDTTSPSTTADTQKPEAVVDQGTIKLHVYEMIDKASTSVSFPKGKSTLTQEETQKLKSYVNDMKNKYRVDTMIVAAWADRDYPPNGETLGDAASKLAEARAEAVQKALKNGGAGDVDTYKMVERPNWFQKVFATRGAELKGAADSDNWLTDDVAKDIGSKLRAKGGPGKVVVVTRFEDQLAAH